MALGVIVEGSQKWPVGQNMRKAARQGKEHSSPDYHQFGSETTLTLLTSVGLGIAKAGNKQAGTTSRYRDTGNEC